MATSIHPINLTDVHQLQSLVEHRTIYNLKNCQLNIFETYQQTKDVEISFDGLVVSSMMRGKKYVALEESKGFAFVPGESIIVPKGQRMQIDFPEASFQKPVQCATIAMDWEQVQAHIDFLNEHYPLGNEGKPWELNFQYYHFYNNQELVYSINKLIAISMEDNLAKDALADLTFKTLIVRIIQTQNLLSVDAPNGQNKIMELVMQYIHANLSQEIPMEVLAKLAMMSKPAFFKAFKLAFGKTPVQYIHQKRMEKAQLLLRTSDMHISEIAYECGFNNVPYFCRMFKQQHDVSPSTWRAVR